MQTKTPDLPRSTASMAMDLRCSKTGHTRSLAIPPELTYEDAVDFVLKWMGPTETLAGVYEYT